ncbi:MAG: PAS domain S-box protein [Chloroflexota bacterium]|nr:PAS domain S-box protein [Chloroflexota bacterium]
MPDNKRFIPENEYDQFFKTVIANSTDGIIVVDDAGVVQFANPAADEFFRGVVEQLVGYHFGVPAIDQFVELELWNPTDKALRVVEMRANEITWQGSTAHLAILRNITERKNHEQEIEEQKRWLTETGQMANVGAWTLDVRSEQVWWSKVTREIHEVPEDFDPNYDLATEFFPGRARIRIRSAIQNAIIQGKPYNLTLPFVTAKGNKLWVQSVGHPEYKDDEVVRLRGTFQDVTEQHRIQIELAESEKRLRNLFDYAPTGFVLSDIITDPSGKPSEFIIRNVNRSFEAILGLRAEDVIGESPIEAIPGITGAPIWPAIFNVARTGEPQRLNFYSDIFNRYFDISVYQPAAQQIAIVFNEITKEVLAERALQDSEKKYRQLFENILNGFALHEIILNEKGKPVDFRFLDVNSAFESQTGIKAKNVTGKKATRVLPGVEKTDLIDRYGQVALTGEAQQFELFYEPLGKHFLVLAFSPEDGQFATVFLDISDQKKTEEALEQSERHYRELFNHAILGFALHEMIYDENGEAQDFVYTEVNHAFGVQTGQDTATLSGKTASEVLPSAKETGLLDIYGEVGLTGEPVQIDYYSPDWDRYFNISAFSLEPGMVVSSVSDISDRILAENQLRQSEKKYRTLYTSMTQGVIYQNSKGEILSANFAAEHILGLSLAEMQGKSPSDPAWKAIRMNGDALPGEEHPAMVALRTGEVVEDFNFGIYNPRRRKHVWISASSIPQFREGEEAPYQVFSTFTEITDLVRVRRVLEKRVKELRCMAHVSSILQKEADLEVVCPLVIAELVAGMEFPDLAFAELMLGDRVFHSEEPFEPTENVLTASINGTEGSSGELRVFYKENVPFLDPEDQNLLNDIANRLSLWHKQRLIQERLVESEKRFRNAILHAPNPIMIHAEGGEIMEINDAWLTLSGYGRDEIDTVEKWLQLAQPDRYQKIFTALNQIVIKKRKTVDGQYAVHTKDGETLQWYFSSAPLGHLPDGRVILITMANNITDSVAAKQEKEEYFQRIIALSEIDQVMISTLQLDEVLDVITNQLQNIIQFNSMSVLLIEGDYHKIIACQGFMNTEEIVGLKFPAEPGYPNYDVIIKREPVMVKDVAKVYPNFIQPKQVKNVDGIKSWLGVPLTNQNGVIGMFTIDRQEEDPFTQGDIEIAMQYANRAAIAITNAQLFEQAKQNIERLEVLRQIDNAIIGSETLQDALDVILKKIQDNLEVDIVTVYKYEKESKALTYLQNEGFRSVGDPSIKIPLGQGFVGTVAETQEPVSVPEVRWKDSGLKFPFSFEEEGVISYYAFPLVVKGELQGVIELKHRSRLEPDEDWMLFAETLARQTAIAIDNLTLFTNLAKANEELREAYDATIEGWAHALEIRDKETEGHSRRVVQLTVDIAKKLGLSEDELVHIRRGVLLHDIGKMAIPDKVLHKPGPLDDAEWEIMRMHPDYAYEMLKSIDYLRPALTIPHYHHERWDGSGYPEGLQGKDIPLAARIFAVVDVWDALTSDRPYRKAWSEEKTKQYLRDMAGKEFDPEMVEIFLEMVDSD